MPEKKTATASDETTNRLATPATMLYANMPSLDDAAGRTIPAGLPMVFDAHVHVFPDHMFDAVRRWFDDNAWHIRYQLSTTDVFEFLLQRGVAHIIALQYAHAPGLARQLNRYMADQCRHYPGRVTGMATVFPGEPDAAAILQQAFDDGLGGLKLHAHVQCFDINADDTAQMLEICQSRHKPVVVHIGREPKSAAYRCDPHLLCAAGKLEQVLHDFPALKVCVPHLGFSETDAYRALIERYDNLWLDTTMVLTDYFDIDPPVDLRDYRADRIMYGSDFPNIPFAWDRELKWVRDAGLDDHRLELLLNKNAAAFFELNTSVNSDL